LVEFNLFVDEREMSLIQFMGEAAAAAHCDITVCGNMQ
jgi:hypothetical protein